jgi:molybdenum cofactor synthesis domain-containing protein
MNAEIFAIGSELCFGRIQDVNSSWIADKLTKLGVYVQRITCIPDHIEDVTSALRESLSRRPTFLFLTGGLGPTEDDLTIEALSMVTGMPTQICLDALNWMAEKEHVPVEELDRRLHKMAMSLAKAECIRNPVGWAPATYLRVNHTEVFALPGPPIEVRGFFNEYICRSIQDRAGGRSCHARFAVAMYEEELSSIVHNVMDEEEGVYVKPLVSGFKPDVGLPIDILVFSDTERGCGQKMERVVQRLSELVSSHGRTLKPLDSSCDDR